MTVILGVISKLKLNGMQDKMKTLKSFLSLFSAICVGSMAKAVETFVQFSHTESQNVPDLGVNIKNLDTK